MIAQQDFIYLINLDNPQPLTPVLGVIECLHSQNSFATIDYYRQWLKDKEDSAQSLKDAIFNEIDTAFTRSLNELQILINKAKQAGDAHGVI
ncbi:hypothetical protein AOC10_06195 [Polynucleobacter asymbioticus]|uniref:hypothetical protein n=1 Tax=Polynucleobacter asymbioticus TaxID=576611 RepID=UPI0008FB41BB|nr:hypothetical protein [Polynucleobacter asymbioticus]APC06140.1 hypothetical protein AOC10_06195 [Polynucleobacter asymbioticus]